MKERSGKGIEMSGKTRIKIIVDLLMTFALLFLMPYGMVGEAAHEWIGTGMFVLFVLHHILNRGWTAHFLKGRYTIQRLVQTVLVLLVLSSFLGAMLSGILLSRHVFAFLDIRGGNIIRKKSPYGVCLLGIYMDVPPFGNTLEYGDKNGRKAIPKAVICPEMDCTRGSIAHCRIWDICVYQTGDRKLYVSQNTFCVF